MADLSHKLTVFHVSNEIYFSLSSSVKGFSSFPSAPCAKIAILDIPIPPCDRAGVHLAPMQHGVLRGGRGALGFGGSNGDESAAGSEA